MGLLLILFIAIVDSDGRRCRGVWTKNFRVHRCVENRTVFLTHRYPSKRWRPERQSRPYLGDRKWRSNLARLNFILHARMHNAVQNRVCLRVCIYVLGRPKCDLICANTLIHWQSNSLNLFFFLDTCPPHPFRLIHYGHAYSGIKAVWFH